MSIVMDTWSEWVNTLVYKLKNKTT